MKISFIILVSLLMIGTILTLMGNPKKDTFESSELHETDPVSVATTTNGNDIDTIVVIPKDIVKPPTVHSNEPQIAHEGPEFTLRTWAGKYQIIEFGEVIPDSNPMKYDAYAYTDFIVTDNGLEHDVSIALTNKDGRKTTMNGYGVRNIDRALEVYSESNKLLFILEDYTSDRVYADTKFTWVNLQPQLSNTAGVYYMKRQDIQ
jgi:hypothetical protein